MSKSDIEKYLAKIGHKGGLARSKAKTLAARRNAKLPRRRLVKGTESE